MRRAVPTLACALVLALAGCGSGDDAGEKDGAATSSSAAILRSRLAASLQSQAYLQGSAVLVGARKGFRSDAFTQAQAALTEQTGEVADILGGGDLRRRTTALSDALTAYGQGLAREDPDATQAASQAITRARTGLSQGLAPIAKPAGVGPALLSQITQQKLAINALVEGRLDATRQLARAAGEAAGLAEPLAAGEAARRPKAFTGDATGRPAELRALLTTQLADQAHLVGAESREIVGQGIGAPSTQAAKDTLRASATMLEETVGAVWGQEARTEFVTIWRRHLSALEAYASATTRLDAADARAALAGLDTFRTDLVAFLTRRGTKLTAATLRGKVSAYLDDTTATIRSFATGDAGAYRRSEAAADRMPLLAAVIARGVVAQFPGRFPGT